ncbi:MAG: multicomponent K+:H+ antiporter subunit F [Gammaproteobacteria bacterium]|jgi:multicomponent K+:H+ antiporter subunit F
MLATAIEIALAMVSVALMLCIWRLVCGPSLPDRFLALDTLFINIIAVLVLVGMLIDDDIYFEAALLIAMFGFVGTVAFAKYMLRGDIIE